jgi:hypothetical protein
MSGDETAYEKAKCRATARFLLKADVAEYYRSVYTHCIPWALAGKDVAKAALRNNESLWCDPLDKTTQWGQGGQTNGIPCGPDTSFVLGELILSAVDAALEPKVRFVSGYRYFDDYEFAVGSQGEAEEALFHLQDELGKFCLQLNPVKTKIIHLPLVSEGSLAWVKAFPHAPTSRHSRGTNQKDELLEFYMRVFEHRITDPTSQVVSLAMSRMPEKKWDCPDWNLAQDLMSQAVITDTGSMHQYVRALVKLSVDKGLHPDPERLFDCLSRIILHHAPRGHGSEVAWALWACMVFDVKLSEQCGQAISQIDDDVVALLALELESRGGFLSPLDKTRWQIWMNKDQLRDEHWLLAYEALVRRWLPSLNGRDYISSDAAFSWLRSHGVQFTKKFRKVTRRTLEEIRLIDRGYDVDDDANDKEDYDEDDSDDTNPFD